MRQIQTTGDTFEAVSIETESRMRTNHGFERFQSIIESFLTIQSFFLKRNHPFHWGSQLPKERNFPQ